MCLQTCEQFESLEAALQTGDEVLMAQSEADLTGGMTPGRDDQRRGFPL